MNRLFNAARDIVEAEEVKRGSANFLLTDDDQDTLMQELQKAFVAVEELQVYEMALESLESTATALKGTKSGILYSEVKSCIILIKRVIEMQKELL